MRRRPAPSWAPRAAGSGAPSSGPPDVTISAATLLRSNEKRKGNPRAERPEVEPPTFLKKVETLSNGHSEQKALTR